MNPIAQYIEEREVEGMRIFTAPTGAKDVVTVRGSVLGGGNMLPRDKQIAAYFVSELLDAGTRTKSKDTIRESIAARGMSLSFSTGGDRTYFSGSCLPEDLSKLLDIIVECLGEATFLAKEISNVRALTLGELAEEETDTRAQAAGALSRLIYIPEHSNYAEPTPKRITQAQAITRADVVSFGKKLGRGGLIVAIAGDIENTKAQQYAAKSFRKLSDGTLFAPEKRTNTKTIEARETLVSIKDKTNTDVFLGAPLSVTREHELYLPLFALSVLLGGGGFTSHLNRTIRERDGLTYGAYAGLGGFGDGADGNLRIYASFSPNRYAESVAKLREEIDIFFRSGITQKALDAFLPEHVGKYLVGLSTTQGIATMLHKIGTEGKPLSYIDEFPALIGALTLAELHEAAKLIPIEKLSLAAAGPFK